MLIKVENWQLKQKQQPNYTHSFSNHAKQRIDRSSFRSSNSAICVVVGVVIAVIGNKLDFDLISVVAFFSSYISLITE